MKKRYLKLIALFLAMTTLLCACGAPDNSATSASGSTKESESTQKSESTQESSVPEGWLVDEVTEITVLFSSDYEWSEDTWLLQKIKERTGVQIVPTTYDLATCKEKGATIIASGELPDIMSGALKGAEIQEYGAQGAFVAIEDYMELLPNLKELFIDDPECELEWNALTNGGKHYTFPNYKIDRDVNHGIMYRQDVFEELGIEPWGIGDTEGFYECLVALKEAYPDSYPFTVNGLSSVLSRFAGNWGLYDIAVTQDNDGTPWYCGATSPKFKAMLDFFKKLYDEGLMHPEIFSLTLDDMNAQLLNDEAFVINGFIGRIGLLREAAVAVDPNTDFEMAFGYNIENGMFSAATKVTRGEVCVAANKENTELCVKFMNWLYSEEAAELVYIGEEGDNFEWDKEGWPVYPEINGGDSADLADLEKTYGIGAVFFTRRTDRRANYYHYTEGEQKAQDMGAESGYYIWPRPTAPLGFEDEYKTLSTAVLDEYGVFAAKYITDPSYGDKEWNEYVEKVNSQYADRLIDIMNTHAADKILDFTK